MKFLHFFDAEQQHFHISKMGNYVEEMVCGRRKIQFLFKGFRGISLQKSFEVVDLLKFSQKLS
jgi:hypothetical protein